MFVATLVTASLAACTSSSVVRTTSGASNSSASSTATTPGVTGSAPAQQSAPAARVSQPRPGATYRVQRGETLYRIATNNGITPLDLALWNNIPPPYTIYPGQRLRLYPPGASTPAASTAANTAGSSTRTPTTAGPATAVASRFGWRWPTDTRQLISNYVPNDITRQGIDIAGNPGDPVRASADGTVVYSGTGMVGYGEFIIIKHDDQWLTAYGHNRRRLVNEGEVVKAGQQIAELGNTGAARNMLHFEIRLEGKPVDPLLYLPR